MSDKTQDWIWSIAIIIFFIFLGIKVWGWFFPSDSDITTNSPYSSSYSDSSGDYKEDCAEPENPYDDGSGHYAGFEWGENGNSCGGNSSSFIEGCEEYLTQEEDYDTCLSN